MAYQDQAVKCPDGETGTLNFEGLAGLTAILDYLASIGTRFGDAATSDPLRKRILAGYDIIGHHEAKLTERFLTGIQTIPGIRLFGLDSPTSGHAKLRTPTFAIRLDNFPTANELASKLQDNKIVSQAGHFYALNFVKKLGLIDTGGVVRIGFVHYNTMEEVDYVLSVLKALAKPSF